MNTAQRSLADIAQEQHGVVSLGQARDSGLSAKQVRAWVAAGHLEVLFPSVLRMAGTTRDFSQQAMAATLAAGAGAMASHRAAGTLWGFPNLPRWPDILVGIERRIEVPGLIVHRSRWLPDEDRQEVQSIPATSPLRTAFDLTTFYDKRRFEPIFDHGLIHRLFTRHQVEDRLALLRTKRQRFPGIEAWLAERPISARPVGSEFEVDLFKALDRAGLPRPIPQYRVVLADGTERFLDFGYAPPVRLGLEPQGYIWHASRRAWERGLIRDNGLIAAGWALLPVGWDQLRAHPAQVAETIRRALQARGGL